MEEILIFVKRIFFFVKRTFLDFVKDNMNYQYLKVYIVILVLTKIIIPNQS